MGGAYSVGWMRRSTELSVKSSTTPTISKGLMSPMAAAGLAYPSRLTAVSLRMTG